MTLYVSSGPTGVLSCGMLGTHDKFVCSVASTSRSSSSSTAMRSPMRRGAFLAASILASASASWVRRPLTAVSPSPSLSARANAASNFFSGPINCPICFEASLRCRRSASTSCKISRRRSSPAKISLIGALSFRFATCSLTHSGFSRIKLMSNIIAILANKKASSSDQDEEARGATWIRRYLTTGLNSRFNGRTRSALRPQKGTFSADNSEVDFQLSNNWLTPAANSLKNE